MPSKKTRSVFFVAMALSGFASILFSVISSCNNSDPKMNAADSLVVGRQLAQKYCVSCHQFPEPTLIDKKTWEIGVLPAMAEQLKIQNYMGQYFADEHSALSTSEWQQIVSYYKISAPKTLIIPKSNAKTDWAIFSLKRPLKINSKQIALTTLVSFNPNDQKIYTADASNNLYRWNAQLQPELCKVLPSPGTNAIYNQTSDGTNQAVITCIGTLPPTDVSNGKVLSYNLNKKEKVKSAVLYADSLPRAVQTVAADFDKNGLIDYAVCGFGHDRGGLYWLKQLPNHHFKTLPIRLVPGATQLITGDFNNDGWTDLMCLFAQADEGIWLFLNDHHGSFGTKNILHFPPIYGSSSFQMIDFNHDGNLDILYTAGDNSDYSKVLKPYHGVYIFLNQGNLHFKKQFFYPIDGCTKALAADFRQNGHLDIAVISFFADFKNDPTEGFEYLEQTKGLQFVPHKIPIDKYGRWLTMDVSDYNHDGFPDVILGNFSMWGSLNNQKDLKPDWDTHEPLIVLKNISKKKR